MRRHRTLWCVRCGAVASRDEVVALCRVGNCLSATYTEENTLYLMSLLQKRVFTCNFSRQAEKLPPAWHRVFVDGVKRIVKSLCIAKQV